MRNILTIGLILLFIVACRDKSKQLASKPVILSLDLKKINYWWHNPVIKENFTEKLSDTSYIKIYLTDYKGALNFEIYNLNNKLIEKGSYENALDIFKYYVTIVNGSNGEGKIVVEEYYEPLPDGVWIFYSNGKIIKREKYSKGLIDFPRI